MVCALVSIAGFVAFQTYGYLVYCGASQVAAQRPWCAYRVPDLYSFVQQHYWYHCSEGAQMFLTLLSPGMFARGSITPSDSFPTF